MTELQWIVDAYVLVLASLLLTGGTLGDMFGRRKAFIGGLGAVHLGLAWPARWRRRSAS